MFTKGDEPMIFNINGEIVDKSQLVFSAVSRCYRYGDGFFESMRYSNGRLLHGELHFSRVLKTALLLKIQLPENFNLDQLERCIK